MTPDAQLEHSLIVLAVAIGVLSAAFLAGMFLKWQVGAISVGVVAIGLLAVAAFAPDDGVGETMSRGTGLLAMFLFAVLPLIASFGLGVLLSTAIRASARN